MKNRAMVLGLALCVLTAMYISPVFAKSFYSLILQNSGTGTGVIKTIDSSVECETSCTVFLDSGSSVILFARPENGSRFVGWSGNCYLVDKDNRCHVKINDEIEVTAFFDIAAVNMPISDVVDRLLRN